MAALTNTSQQVHFYFVVPHTTFPHFKGVQNFMTAKDKVTMNAPTGGMITCFAIVTGEPVTTEI